MSLKKQTKNLKYELDDLHQYAKMWYDQERWTVGNLLVIGGLTYQMTYCNKGPKDAKFQLVLTLVETNKAA